MLCDVIKWSDVKMRKGLERSSPISIGIENPLPLEKSPVRDKKKSCFEIGIKT